MLGDWLSLNFSTFPERRPPLFPFLPLVILFHGSLLMALSGKQMYQQRVGGPLVRDSGEVLCFRSHAIW